MDSRKKTSKSDPLFILVESISAKVDTISSRFEALDKKLDLHIQKTSFEFTKLSDLDTQQNKILEEHHQRSTELKRDNELREKDLRDLIERKETQIKADLAHLSLRVEKAEAPQKYLFWTKKVFLWIAAAGVAVGVMAAFLNWLQGL